MKIKDLIKITALGFVLYSIVGLLGQFVFSYFNQSLYQERQLTTANFVIPWFITFGLMICGSILLYKKPRHIYIIWITLCISLILEIYSIKWQIEFLIWAFETKVIGEITPILTGLSMIFYIFFTMTRLILTNRDKTAYNNV